LPNEGNTFGALPVFLRVNPEGFTTSIVAPSISWNKVVKITGTFRGYRFFSETRSVTAIVSASTHVNRSVNLQYVENTRARLASTTEAILVARQNVFYRFFGIGPHTQESDESSYTRLIARAMLRKGLNLREGLNAALVLETRADGSKAQGVPGLPLAQVRYGEVVSFDKAIFASQGLSLSYDSRPNLDYSMRGLASELTATASEGTTGSFARVIFQTRGLIPQTRWLFGAARLYVEQVFGPRIPFYQLPTLGGEELLRGFTANRFTDRGAWCVDFEERIRLFQTHLFGVTADWRLDPYVTVGQVYGKATEAFDDVQKAVGIGFRTWVHPNILGRVDAAYGGEGLKFYVVLGYPI
jgi:hypothetical protein